jgi:hypothetical protein
MPLGGIPNREPKKRAATGIGISLNIMFKQPKTNRREMDEQN